MQLLFCYYKHHKSLNITPLCIGGFRQGPVENDVEREDGDDEEQDDRETEELVGEDAERDSPESEEEDGL